MADAGLLGVGNGVVRPTWPGKQEMGEKKADLAPKQLLPTGETKARDDRIVSAAVLELGSQITRHSQAVDLDSVNANTTQNQDVTCDAPGALEAGDYVICMGGATLNHGIVIQATIPAPANDTIRIRYSNLTAGVINPASMTLYFLFIKPTSII